MQRVLSTVTLLGLLVATAAAFVITEHLKLIKSPISGARVTKAFSPVCGCAESRASIRLKLRHPNRLTVTILDSSRRTVATLATDVHEAKGYVTFRWNGRTDEGAVAGNGSYQAQIKLARRTILLPNKIVVDTTTPAVVSASASRGYFAPGAGHTLAIRYVFSEDAHPVVYLGGRRISRGRRSRPSGVIKWNGLRHGSPLPVGRYVLEIGALDLAGNETPADGRKRVVVFLRDLALSQASVRVGAGARFSIGVETAAATYTWRLGGKHGTAHRKALRLRAPSRHGRYRLVVSEHGHKAYASVIVGRK